MDPGLGPFVYALAMERSVTQQVYVSLERVIQGRRYDIFVRLYWTDADRHEILAMMGFVANLDEVRKSLFPELARRSFGRLLNPGGGSPQLELQILDAHGQRVFATGEPIPSLTVRRTLDMRFYPASDIRTRLADYTPRKDWTMLVGPGASAALTPDVELRGYSVAAVSVLLMFMGVFLSSQGLRREREMARRQADFVSHVSHQLKTPLSILNGVCDTLALDRARSSERLAQYLEMMRYSVTRLTTLVERILEFSRADEGCRTYEMEPVALGALIRETVDAFRLALDDPDARIEVIAADPSLVVLADPVALEQALVNLLDNAVKYSDGEKHITVRVFRSVSHAVVEVSDRGIGISQPDQARIFERFYRGSGSSINREGFGLGLAIVRELVAAHHGTIEVDSRRGIGSTFRVHLPVMKGNRATADAHTRGLLARLLRRTESLRDREPNSVGRTSS
jgi:signal transduction histidine kinase